MALGTMISKCSPWYNSCTENGLYQIQRKVSFTQVVSKNLHKPNEQNINNKPTILLRSGKIYINIVRRIVRLFPKIRY